MDRSQKLSSPAEIPRQWASALVEGFTELSRMLEKMSTRGNTVMRTEQWYREQADEMLARAATMKKIESSPDDFPQGTVLTFSRPLPQTASMIDAADFAGRLLIYTALKIVTVSGSERWYVTGSTAATSPRDGRDWAQLLAFIGLENMDTVRRLTGAVQVFA